MIWSVLHNCCYKNVVCNEIYCKQPAGAKWLSFSFILWSARRKYIHGIYCNGGRQVGGSAMDLGAKPVA